MPEDGFFGKGWAMAGLRSDDEIQFIANRNAVEHSFRHLANKALNETAFDHLDTARARLLDLIADRQPPSDGPNDRGDPPDPAGFVAGDDFWL